jgi:hypothetical protein
VEVPEMVGIVQDNDLASSASVGNASRLVIFWFARRELEFIPERMWDWERIIPSLPESMELSNMKRGEEIKNR